MASAVVSFVVVFLLVATGGILLSYRQSMVHRITRAINPAPLHQKMTVRSLIQDTATSIARIAQQFKHVLPKNDNEISAARARLSRAGYRNNAAVDILNGSKVLVPFLLCIVVFMTGWGKVSPFLIYLLALGFGFLAPEYWLDRQIKGRQDRIRRGLPDVLDMLVVCTEAGLSLDQATARTAEELSKAQPDLCDELGLVVLEQRAGRARSEAWKQMAERTDVDSLRSLVSMLVQSERFGTSIAKTMRNHSDAMRVKRIQEIEEQAAKTSVKLVFPLVLFIFPSVFLVTLGPAIIRAIDSFSHYNH
ncbi:MAG: type II secretion system F family protein [Terracidiphilus sp.]|nr:type II secretion system F family protein [Terracidiphilus sp.]